jgi:WD40 repeat protein
MAVSLAEYVITGVRDKAIWLWDSCGTLLKTSCGVTFHPGRKHLIIGADDKTLHCWDLSRG